VNLWGKWFKKGVMGNMQKSMERRGFPRGVEKRSSGSDSEKEKGKGGEWA
jgi:hypothetical protein